MRARLTPTSLAANVMVVGVYLLRRVDTERRDRGIVEAHPDDALAQRIHLAQTHREAQGFLGRLFRWVVPAVIQRCHGPFGPLKLVGGGDQELSGIVAYISL